MTSYILTAAITAGIVYFIMLFSFLCEIENRSKKREPFKAFGTKYWFMTQDQIQKAVTSIVKGELSYRELENEDTN